MRFTTYFYKDRNGKLLMGLTWDYNISLGNANYYEGQYTNGWYTTGDYFAMPSWWDRFRADTNFMALCHARWQALRKDILHRTNFLARLDALDAALDEPQRRNSHRWSILGTYVWPDHYYSTSSYVHEVTWMQQWANGRMAWIDGQWNTVIADFAATLLTITVGQTIIFTNLSYGCASAFQWNFGDGVINSGRHPAHTYLTAGWYDVTLVCSNYTAQNGWSNDILTRTNYIHALPEPCIVSAALLWLVRRVCCQTHE